MSEGTTPHSSPTKPSYLLRHWRGKLPLNEAFWRNTLLLNLALFVVLGEVTSRLQHADVIFVLPYMVTMAVLLPSLTIWQIVGVWQSAQSYKQQRRSVESAPLFARLSEGIHWAYMAQILCVLWTGTLIEFVLQFTGLPSQFMPFALFRELVRWLFM